MKARTASRCALAAGLLLALLAPGRVVAAQTQSAERGKEGKSVVVQGELVDSRCYLSLAKRGSEHVKCAVACAKDGLPLHLVDAKGRYYTLVIQANEIAENAGLQAEVEGMLFGDSIIPTKMKVNRDGSWTEVKLPEQMM